MADDEQLDSCAEYQGLERRKHCEMVVQLRTMYLEDKKNRDEWRRCVEQKLDDILGFLSKIRGPYNAGLWALRLAIGGMIAGAIGWFIKHFEVNLK